MIDACWKELYQAAKCNFIIIEIKAIDFDFRSIIINKKRRMTHALKKGGGGV